MRGYSSAIAIAVNCPPHLLWCSSHCFSRISLIVERGVTPAQSRPRELELNDRLHSYNGAIQKATHSHCEVEARNSVPVRIRKPASGPFYFTVSALCQRVGSYSYTMRSLLRKTFPLGREMHQALDVCNSVMKRSEVPQCVIHCVV